MKPERFIRRIESVVRLRDKTVLDIGCGDGIRTVGIAAVAKRVVAVDADRRVLAQAKRENGHPNVSYVRASALRLPFPKESFDVVLFTMSFHHLRTRDMARVVAEALRVTKPHGFLVWFEHGWRGSMFEAEARFDFGDGDIRDVKAYAYHVLLTERRMQEVAEFVDTASYPYRSTADFKKLEKPVRGTPGEWAAFLKRHGWRLQAETRTHVFQRKPDKPRVHKSPLRKTKNR